MLILIFCVMLRNVIFYYFYFHCAEVRLDSGNGN